MAELAVGKMIKKTGWTNGHEILAMQDGYVWLKANRGDERSGGFLYPISQLYKDGFEFVKNQHEKMLDYAEKSCPYLSRDTKDLWKEGFYKGYEYAERERAVEQFEKRKE